MTATIDQSDVLTRDQIAPEDTWDLTTIFASDDDWNAGAGAIVKRPVAVYVERVYEDGDFTGLGI